MEFVTQNGNVTIDVMPASFKDACNLKKAVAKGLLGKDLGIGESSLMDVKIDSILQLLVDIDTSDDFEKAIMECLKCCIYDKGGKNLKITTQLFDDIPETREDYYEIITKCVEVNLRPFSRALLQSSKRA